MTGSNAVDSDIRMMIATQVAYLDADEGMTVKELVDRIIANYGGQDGHLDGKLQRQLDTATYIRDKIAENNLYDCENWIIKEKMDSNMETGFYGCLIDTGDGNAILGFRGSERYDFVNDWVLADFGLLNNPETTQQRQAEEFTRYVNEKYGDSYDSFSFSGHSLGGNLAEHATITAPEGMNIRRCTSFDGPGFSDEYIAAHGTQIGRNARYVDHYQYSLVGALLNPLPGTNYRTIAAHDGDGVFGAVTRHDTRNIEFDDSGSVQAGDLDPLSAVMGPISRDIENGAPLLLWVTCPTLAALWTLVDKGYTVLLGMKDKAEQLLQSIGIDLQKMKQGVTNWFRNLFGNGLTGEFEINAGVVTAMSGSMDQTAIKLREISRSLSAIAGQLHYSSLSGAYYKSKLRSLGSAVVRDAEKIAALAAAARDCAQYSTSEDAQAAQCYT